MRCIYYIITCDGKTNTQRVFVVVAVYSKKFQRELTKVQSYLLWTRLRGNEIMTLGGI